MRYQEALIVLASVAELVAAHGAIVRVVGDAGGRGSAIGIDPSTPRDGTKRRPFQQDTTRFKGPNRNTCGETLAGGQNNIQSGVREVMNLNGDTLPQVTPGGVLTLTLHQVNGDGAGPYRCEVDPSGTGNQFQFAEVLQNVPGRNGNSKNRKTDFPLAVRVPRGIQCTGDIAGKQNVCIGRCKNPARAGPFGGCYPFQIVGSNNRNNNDFNRNNNFNQNNNDFNRNNNFNQNNNNNNNNFNQNNNDNNRFGNDGNRNNNDNRFGNDGNRNNNNDNNRFGNDGNRNSDFGQNNQNDFNRGNNFGNSGFNQNQDQNRNQNQFDQNNNFNNNNNNFNNNNNNNNDFNNNNNNNNNFGFRKRGSSHHKPGHNEDDAQMASDKAVVEDRVPSNFLSRRGLLHHKGDGKKDESDEKVSKKVTVTSEAKGPDPNHKRAVEQASGDLMKDPQFVAELVADEEELFKRAVEQTGDLMKDPQFVAELVEDEEELF